MLEAKNLTEKKSAAGKDAATEVGGEGSLYVSTYNAEIKAKRAEEDKKTGWKTYDDENADVDKDQTLKRSKEAAEEKKIERADADDVPERTGDAKDDEDVD